MSISVYCAVVAKDFEQGIRLAINHSGDSDSTGSITGNPPTGTPKQSTPECDPNGSPDFYLDIPNPIDFSTLAGMAIRTLSDVYGVAHDGFLECGAYDSAGNAIALPE